MHDEDRLRPALERVRKDIARQRRARFWWKVAIVGLLAVAFLVGFLAMVR